MTARLGFIGDIHGDVDRLQALLGRVEDEVERLIFLGDYVNRGRFSCQVLDVLVGLEQSAVECTFLEGNHDAAFRAALEGRGLDAFLQMGGAATIRSYISSIGAEWEAAFVAAVSPDHRRFLQSLEAEFRLGNEILASHYPRQTSAADGDRYHVSGHVPQGSRVPMVDRRRAFIDTGCGTFEDGKLTCFFWPSATWIQA